jgi:DNA-binding beta-propeller fold protein YncE
MRYDRRQQMLILIGSLAVLVPHSVAQSQTVAAELKVINTFKIGGAGRWDYPVVDAPTNRLYVARGTHLQVIDTNKGTVIGDVADLQGCHGTAIVRDKNLGFVTSGRENAVAVFDLDTFKVVRKISTLGSGGRNPDAILYDPAAQKVFAFCAGGDAVAIDPASVDAEPVAIPCGGKLEYGQADGAGHVFVNDEDHSQVIVIDSKLLKVTDRWPLAPVTGPSGLAIDETHHRLFSVGRNQKMAILDSGSGKLLASVAIGKGVDGCAFDPKLGVALSANGADGTVTVVHENSPGEFSAVQTLATMKSGRTIADNSQTSQFFIPATLPAEGEVQSQFGIVVVGAAN